MYWQPETVTGVSPPTWIFIALGSAVALAAFIRSLWKARLEKETKRARWEGGIDADRKAFSDLLSEVRDDVKRLLRRTPGGTVAGRSRLGLTDLGKKVSRKIAGAEWARRLAPDLKEQLAGKAAYEIQAACMEYARTLELSGDEKTLVLEVAFEHGLAESDVREVVAIELRDRLLKLAEPEAPDEAPDADRTTE